jgi:uncharacterized membrane protein YdjX (TVP38/TMEM64 family)
MSATRRQVGSLLLLGLAVAAVALLVPPSRAVAALSELRSRPLALALVLGAVYLFRPLAAWPVGLVSAFVGYVLGLPGLPVAMVGGVATTLPPYLLARRVGATGPLGWAGRLARRGVDATGGARGVAAARLAPVPTDVISVAAGLADVPLLPYVAGTTVGVTPWVVAGVVAGDSAARVAAGVDTPLALVVGAAALAVLLLAGPLYERVGTPAPDAE